MPRSHVISFLTAWMVLYSSPSITKAADPSAEELIRLAPTLKSGDGKYSSIEISGYVDGESFMRFDFHVRHRAPDRYALYLADGSDNTPVIYFDNGKLLMYNAVEGAVLYLSNASFNYTFCFEEAKFSHRFAVSRSDEPCSILFDVKSLYDREGMEDTVTRADDGMFRLTRKLMGGKSLVALVDPSRRCPFRQIAVLKVDSDKPFILVRELSVNEDVHGAWPVFPPKDVLAEKVALKDWSSDAQFGGLAVSEFMARSLLARPAIRDKEAREYYERRFGAPKDWSHVEGNDRRISQSIRELIGTPIDTKRARVRKTAK
jgi:hypothetical protein